jgi:hypothetical protein
MGTFGRGVVVGDIVNQAPTASLALSATSMTNTGSIKATVTGTDLDGKISKLTLLVDGKVYATATASPWVAVLSGLTKGAHSVQAIATDNNGAIGGSAAKTISVVWNYALVVNASTKSNWFGGLIVNYSLPTPLPATTLQLLDASGTVRKSVSLTAGSVRTRFTAVSGYPAGNYTLRIVSNGAIVATRTFAKL